MEKVKTIFVDGSYSHELQIPSSWEFAPLHEVIELVGGSQPPKSVFKYEPEDGYVRLIQIRDYKSDGHKVYIPRDLARRFVSSDEVMIGRYGPPIFQILKGLEGAYNVALMKAVPVCDVFSKEYLFKYLSNRELYNYVDSASDRTAGQSGVNKEHLEKYPVAVPPLAEQKEIARRLDELLTQVDNIKTRLDVIPNILKRFRQSVLAAAVSGRLTEREGDWPIVKIGEIVERIEAGKNLQCIETPPKKDQYGIVKISAVTWGTYDEEESKTLPDCSLFMDSRRIYVGDFLISRANTLELLGNPVIVHRVTKNLMLSDKVLRLVMRTEDKYWMSIFLRSHFGRKQIEDKSTGNQMSMRNIGQKALLDIDIPKPSPEAQTEIVLRVEQLFAYADQIEQRVKDAQARVNHLTQSILAKAFRGELTAEWRAQNPGLISGDNSAVALLEKIKVERESAVKPKRKVKA